MLWLHAPYCQLECPTQTNQCICQTGRQMVGQPNTDTLAWRRTFDLGRHRGEHTGSFLFVVFCSVCRRRSSVAASRKEAKYTGLTNSYIFQPIAIESHSAFSSSTISFLATLGERLTGTSGNLREMLRGRWKRKMWKGTKEISAFRFERQRSLYTAAIPVCGELHFRCSQQQLCDDDADSSHVSDDDDSAVADTDSQIESQVIDASDMPESCAWSRLATLGSRWCRAGIDVSVLHVPTACVTRDAVVLSAERTSLSCWTCTEVTELLNCLNRYVKLTLTLNSLRIRRIWTAIQQTLVLIVVNGSAMCNTYNAVGLINVLLRRPNWLVTCSFTRPDVIFISKTRSLFSVSIRS